MIETRRPADWLLIASIIAGLLVAAMGLYVAGYFTLAVQGRSVTFSFGSSEEERVFIRSYNSHWQSQFFYPAAIVESFLTSEDVRTECMSRIYE